MRLTIVYLTSALLATGLVSVDAAPHQRPAIPLEVDLTYGIFKGVANASTGLSVWKGIRYAAPPVGSLRWQAPRLPSTNRTVVQANAFGPTCPQGYPSIPNPPFVPGNEDCLFLNIYAPGNVKDLPVLVWIHGGGYGLGDGTQDMSTIINANNKSFVAVSIQYRLGAFGFGASQDIASKGVVNAGILDQRFAFEWIQTYISKFGGDPTRVTISGESAGGGSVLLHTIALQGGLAERAFNTSIAASPYLLPMYRANGTQPTKTFNEFVMKAGCANATSKFDCLVSKDTMTLQYASSNVSTSQAYGQWAFLPVIDNIYIQTNPITQLYTKQVNGLKVLAGNNANEGALFVPQNISTEPELVSWMKITLPNLNDTGISTVLATYANNMTALSTDPKYATSGTGPGTAVTVSQIATGQQQRANDIYAEAIFVCPSYFISDAFSGGAKVAYKYQYSVPFASHGDDVSGYFGPSAINQSPDFSQAFRSIWGNFITKDNPSISNTIANGLSTNSSASNPASNFLPWIQGASPLQLNLNITGGTPYQTNTSFGAQVTQFKEPGLRNDFKFVDAGLWEGGRGARCRVWQNLLGSISV